MSCLCITTLCSNSFRFRLAAKPPSMPSLTRNVSTMVLMRRRNCETQVFLFSTWKDEKALCCKYREQSHIPLKEELIRVYLRSGFFKILVLISLQLLSGWWHQRHFHYWRERFSWKLDLFYKGIRPAIDGWSVRVGSYLPRLLFWNKLPVPWSSSLLLLRNWFRCFDRQRFRGIVYPLTTCPIALS